MSKIEKPTEGAPTQRLPGPYVLAGTDGNAFAVMGKVRTILAKAGATKDYIDSYQRAAMSGDYNNLLAVSAAYLTDDA